MPTVPSRVFTNGNSQAVRIPAEFRLDTDRVTISRTEQGDLLIHPVRVGRGAALVESLRALAQVDDAFIAALDEAQADRQPMQGRDGR
jgi:antitoxin VapB